MKELPGDVFVTGQLSAEHVRALAEQGVQSFISNRPDGEAPGMAMSDELEAVAKEAGAAFAYLPMSGALTPDLLAQNAESFAGLPRPIVAYCASGMRSAALWGFAHVEALGVDPVMQALKQAGYPLPQLRPQLQAWAERSEA
jgi:sulfide:quinone oxidoreductase